MENFFVLVKCQNMFAKKETIISRFVTLAIKHLMCIKSHIGVILGVVKFEKKVYIKVYDLRGETLKCIIGRIPHFVNKASH